MYKRLCNDCSGLSGRALNWAFVLLFVTVSCIIAPANASAKVSPQAAKRLAHHTSVSADAAFEEGILIQTLDGSTVMAMNEDKPIFNPASNTKLATTLAVLRKLGADYTFHTRVFTTGEVDAAGVLHGDLFVDGQYMLFGDRQGRELASILNKRGIVSITGDIYVSPLFSMNLESTGYAAGELLLKVLDPWYGRKHQGVNLHAAQPQVEILGLLKVDSPPANASLIAEHTSPPLKDMIKVMLCYSDNKMAELFGDMIGGPTALTQFVISVVGVPADEVQFASTSGLYVNRISPRAMMKVLVTLRAELARSRLELADIMPVAGVDDGTLKKRFTESVFKGAVIGKTGTLPETDGGVSALSGEMHTARRGVFLFVIFDGHGNVIKFRSRQDRILKRFLASHSGARAIKYSSTLDQIDHEDFWK